MKLKIQLQISNEKLLLLSQIEKRIEKQGNIPISLSFPHAFSGNLLAI